MEIKSKQSFKALRHTRKTENIQDRMENVKIPTVTKRTGPGIFAIKAKLLYQNHYNFRQAIFNLCNNCLQSFM